MKFFEYDVVIMGGGTAGVPAALASARSGAKTLLVEQTGSLGGSSSNGMPWGGMFDSEHRQIIFGIPDELVKKSVELGALGYVHYGSDDGHNWISALACVDSEIARFLFRKEVRDSGCDVMLYSTLYDAQVNDGILESIRVFTRGGPVEIKGKAFIDCSGDAALANLSGVPWERGEGEQQQCVASLIRVSGIDLDRFRDYMNSEINVEGWYPWDYRDGPTRGGFTYWCPWKEHSDYFKYPPKQLGFIWSGFSGDVYLNCTNTDADGLDPLSLSEGDYHLRAQAREIASFFKEYVPGFENSYLAHVYDIGVRESRRIKGVYQLTKEDLLTSRAFEDAIGLGAYPLDHHKLGGEVKILTHDELKESELKSSYQIPYRSLINSTVHNLAVAGRCISCTFEAQAALRGIGPCMVEGEAVGYAAAMAVRNGTDFVHLDASALCELLKEKRAVVYGEELGEALK